MYTVSTDFKEAVKSVSRFWDIKLQITTAAGEVLDLTKDDVVLGSFSYKEGATCTDTVQVGSTFSNSIEFELQNAQKQFSDYDFYGAKVRPEIGLWLESINDFEYVPLGEFYVFENVKKFSTIPFSCFDAMSKATAALDASTLVFPMYPADLLTAVATQCGIMLSAELVSEVSLLEFQINSLPGTTLACRDVFAGIGCMIAKNLRMSRAGLLEAFWYTQVDEITTPNTRVGNSEFDDNQVQVSGCYLEDAYGNLYSVGTSDYAIELPTNPCIQSEEIALEVLNKALTRMQELTYRPAEIFTIGNPATQAGDVITHEDTTIGTVTLPVMTMTYKFCGTSTLTTLGVSRTSLDQSTSTEKKLKQAYAKAEKDRVVLESKIEQTAGQVLLEVSQQYADKDEFTQLSVKVDGVGTKVKDTEENVTKLQQTAGQVSVSVETPKGTLSTVINATTWEAKLVTSDGDELSGISCDFETGQFLFNGAGKFTGSINVNDKFKVFANGDVEARGNTVLYGGKYYAMDSSGIGGWTEMAKDGFVMYSRSGVQLVKIGFPTEYTEYPYIWLDAGASDTEESGMFKRFSDGIWLGNSKPVSANGQFYAREGYNGIFISFAEGKAYIVQGKTMQNLYTGEAIARFG